MACDPALRICPMQYAASVESRYKTSLSFGLTLLAEYVTLEGDIVRQKIFVPMCHFAPIAVVKQY